MTFEMKDIPQTITVYNLRADTHEFIGAGDAYIPTWTGLPANSTEIAPGDIPSGHVAVFDSTTAAWSFVEDHRGATVYNSVTGEASYINVLGPVPENSVTIAPSGNYQKWNGVSWVKDEEAEKSAYIADAKIKKETLMQAATNSISTLQDAVDLDMATEEETAELLVWKKYRVSLNRVDITKAPEISWPETPAK